MIARMAERDGDLGHGSVRTIRPNWKNWVRAQLQQHIAETAESAGLGVRPSPMSVGRKARSRPNGEVAKEVADGVRRVEGSHLQQLADRELIFPNSMTESL